MLANDCKAMVVWRVFALALLLFQALLYGYLAVCFWTNLLLLSMRTRHGSLDLPRW